MALRHHAGVGGADAAGADDADRLALEQGAQEEGRQPALVLGRRA